MNRLSYNSSIIKREVPASRIKMKPNYRRRIFSNDEKESL
jgi:hypothetical protein